MDDLYALFERLCSAMMERIIEEKTAQRGREMEEHTQNGGPIPTTVVSLGNEDLGRILNGNETDAPEDRAYMHAFCRELVAIAWANIGAVPLTRRCLGHKKVRHEIGGASPESAGLEQLAEDHAGNIVAARGAGLNAGVFAAEAPRHTHIAREPTTAGRIRALAAVGKINPGTMWQKTGAVAINGWVALSAHDLIVANEAKDAATKELAQAVQDLEVVSSAETVATSTGAMNGKQITTAIKFVFVAQPQQACTRTSIKNKPEGIAFLAGLTSPWQLLLPAARIKCESERLRAVAALEAATAAAAAALSDNQPPAAPTVSTNTATTADQVDVVSMTRVEKRALLAKLHAEMNKE